jgi:hypothetical protein
MKMDKKEFKVGDKVYDIVRGNGVVTVVNGGNAYYPMWAKFENDSVNHSSYTLQGFNRKNDKLPSLYHGHDLIVEVKEPVYEYQVLFTYKCGTFDLSKTFHTSGKEWSENFDEKTDSLFEPSKRIRK